MFRKGGRDYTLLLTATRRLKYVGRNIWTTRTTVHNPLTSLQKVQENLPFSHGDQGCWCVLSGPRTGPSWDVFVSTHHTTSLEKVVARFPNQNRHFVKIGILFVTDHVPGTLNHTYRQNVRANFARVVCDWSLLSRTCLLDPQIVLDKVPKILRFLWWSAHISRLSKACGNAAHGSNHNLN